MNLRGMGMKGLWFVKNCWTSGYRGVAWCVCYSVYIYYFYYLQYKRASFNRSAKSEQDNWQPKYRKRNIYVHSSRPFDKSYTTSTIPANRSEAGLLAKLTQLSSSFSKLDVPKHVIGFKPFPHDQRVFCYPIVRKGPKRPLLTSTAENLFVKQRGVFLVSILREYVRAFFYNPC